MSAQSASTGTGRGARLYRLEAWSRPRAWVGDAALAALVAVPLAAFSVNLLLESRAPGPWVVVLFVDVAVLHVALVGRRTWPRAAFAVVALAALVLALAPDLTLPASPEQSAYAPLLLPSSLVFLFALYAVAAYGRRPAPGLALVVAVVGVVVATVRLAQPQDAAPGTMLAGPWQIGLTLAALLAAVVAAFSLGLFRRMRAEWVDALEERARRAEADREERVRAAAREERARIAREMHDLVAHSLAVIVRQADAGRYAARADPAVAEQVLNTVASTGREALTDMRSLIGVLRRGDDSGPGADGATGPQPTLADLPDLLDRLRGSGLPVTVTEEGPPVRLDRAGELAGYRLVQEALTNVVKHAGPDATAHVALEWDADGLAVIVTDTGWGRSKPAGEDAGHGLVGMRERLRLAGGELVTGPRADGGFLVRGRLPARPSHPARGGVA